MLLRSYTPSLVLNHRRSLRTLCSRADADATARFARAAFGPVGARGIERQAPAARAEALRAAASDMLAASGVPELEGRVLAFLYENAAGLKLMATLDDAGRLLAEVRAGVVIWRDACAQAFLYETARFHPLLPMRPLCSWVPAPRWVSAVALSFVTG